MVLRLTKSEGPKAYYIGVLNMGGRVRRNLRAALDALARMDSRAALQVAREDSLVDQEYDAIMRQLITCMMEGRRSIPGGGSMGDSARNAGRSGTLERALSPSGPKNRTVPVSDHPDLAGTLVQIKGYLS